MDLFNTSQDVDFVFNLDKDIVFFDIESTGLNVLKDRIVQIALIKIKKDGATRLELEHLINPQVPISAEAMAVHGITPDRLKNKPVFAQVAQEIFDFIGDSDIGGYNSDRFDIPILTEEFARCDIDIEMEDRKTIDVQKIFYKMEPRTLRAALKLFCGKNLEDAHDALADVRATIDVFAGQIKKYEGVDYEDGDGFVTKAPIKNDIQAIHEFISDYKIVDYTQRLRRDYQGEIIFNFGKYMNQRVADVFRRDKNYYHWIMQKDFSSQVKKIVKKIMDDVQNPEKQ